MRWNQWMRIMSVAVCAVLLVVATTQGVQAQSTSTPGSVDPATYVPKNDVWYRAEVTAVENSAVENEEDGTERIMQRVTVQIKSGDEEGREQQINHGMDFALREGLVVEKGDWVVLIKSETYDGSKLGEVYHIYEPYRLPALLVAGLIFLAAVLLLGRWKGLGSVVGLGISLLVLVKGVIPWIIRGGDPLLACIVGSIVIATVALFVAHGFTRRTSIAWVSTVIACCLAAVLSYGFVWVARLYGYGSEEAYFLKTGILATLDLRGLLLGSILIGALGILDDITTAQVAVVEELHHANPALTRADLYHRGLSVGREHIASLVNTLALAYAGASFPLILLTATNEYQPVWAAINSEGISEEIVRTLVGSCALVLAVPITTALAAAYYGSRATGAKTR
ncbi:MAG: YibE/F family protein [Patescibacteria group bacterium]